MVTQLNRPRQAGGPAWQAWLDQRLEIALERLRAREAADVATLRANAPTCESMNSSNDSHGLTHKLDEDWKIGRLDGSVPASTQAVNSMSSYKAKIAPRSTPENTRYPHAAYQNPTNNPQVAILLERYGDMRGVFTKDPMFLRIQKPESEGGWGVDLAGLISLGKKYTLERVLWAVKEAKAYPGATNRGRILNHIIRNGLEAGR